MVEMSCEEHDRQAASTQFITHTVGRVLGAMELQATPIDTRYSKLCLHSLLVYWYSKLCLQSLLVHWYSKLCVHALLVYWYSKLCLHSLLVY